ncbi:MAG: HAMP domain-containing histidine kinase [Bacteriovoracaceae bacterium]|nr:HAMP domain-containing histidine kinase [Bacteriovoracaceae bacterium]
MPTQEPFSNANSKSKLSIQVEGDDFLNNFLVSQLNAIKRIYGEKAYEQQIEDLQVDRKWLFNGKNKHSWEFHHYFFTTFKKRRPDDFDLAKIMEEFISVPDNPTTKYMTKFFMAVSPDMFEKIIISAHRKMIPLYDIQTEHYDKGVKTYLSQTIKFNKEISHEAKLLFSTLTQMAIKYTFTNILKVMGYNDLRAKCFSKNDDCCKIVASWYRVGSRFSNITKILTILVVSLFIVDFFFLRLPFTEPKYLLLACITIVTMTILAIINSKRQADHRRIINALFSEILGHYSHQNKISMNTVTEAKFNSSVVSVSEIIHELTTPLTASLGYLSLIDLLANDLDKKESTHITQEMMSFVEKSMSCLQHLSQVLSSMRFLFYSSASSRDDEKKIVSIESLLNNCKQLVTQFMAKQSIDIVINHETPGLKIKVIEEQVIQVVLNLLINAVQAFDKLPQKQIITIKSTQEGNRFCVYVKDQGCGIPKESQSEIFTEHHTTKEKGSGLGLSICTKFLKYNDGTIELVESIMKQGSTFKITIPLYIEQS